jgi:3-oxoacyl-[acyl-carrier protein] reductase
MKLRNKVALVTGASRGIGRGIALALAGEGADVAVNCSTSVKEAEKVAQEIQGLRRRAEVIQADVADKSAVENMVGDVISQFGKIDILVNNAGMSTVGRSEDLDENIWRRGIESC